MSSRWQVVETSNGVKCIGYTDMVSLDCLERLPLMSPSYLNASRS